MVREFKQLQVKIEGRWYSVGYWSDEDMGNIIEDYRWLDKQINKKERKS